MDMSREKTSHSRSLYLRSEPSRANHIPFGQRQFVRRIDEQVREAASGALLAYDGFENLAGHLRRDRSGFGWSGGWEAAGFGRGPLAEVIDAPHGIVFGKDRAGRRLLSLQGGESLRRQFEKPIDLSPGETVFVSLYAKRPTCDSLPREEVHGVCCFLLRQMAVSFAPNSRWNISSFASANGQNRKNRRNRVLLG